MDEEENATTNTTTTTTSKTTTTRAHHDDGSDDDNDADGLGVSVEGQSNGRYLVDQNDVPFLMVGNSPQAAIGNLSEAEADGTSQTGRRTASTPSGSTCCATATRSATATARPRTASNPSRRHLPVQLRPATPNPAYFQRVDDIITSGRARPARRSRPDRTIGWLGTMQANGATKDFNYGAFLGSRYKNIPNIVWMSGNDFQSWGTWRRQRRPGRWRRGSSPPTRTTSRPRAQLPQQHSLNDSTWSSIVSLNAAYTYYPTYAEVLRARSQSPTTPAVHGRGQLRERAQPEHRRRVDANLRRQEYWTMLSGATGSFTATSTPSGSPTAGRPRHRHRRRHAAWVRHRAAPGRAWYDLVPDQTHTLVTAGMARSRAAAASRRTTMRPRRGPPTASWRWRTCRQPGRSRRHDPLGSNVTAQWYDPTNGTYPSQRPPSRTQARTVHAAGVQQRRRQRLGADSNATGGSPRLPPLRPSRSARPRFSRHLTMATATCWSPSPPPCLKPPPSQASPST